MANLTDQLQLEKEMVDFGVSRYRAAITEARSEGRESGTGYGQKLIREYAEPVAALLQEYLNNKVAGVGADTKNKLAQIDPLFASYLGLRVVLNQFMRPQMLTATVITIGKMIEDEIKFSKFEEEQSLYYKSILKDFDRKGTKNYNRKSKILSAKARDYDVRWQEWTTEEKVAVGSKILDAIIKATDLVHIQSDNKHAVKKVIANQEAVEWVSKYIANCEIMHPAHMPCVIPPAPWNGYKDGGYHGLAMRFKTPLIKTRSKKHKEMFDGDISSITNSVNKLQETAWEINKPVLDIMQQVWKQGLEIGLPRSIPIDIPVCPVPREVKVADMTPDQLKAFKKWKLEARNAHNSEGQRVSKCLGVAQAIRLAQVYRNKECFWYVYQCDFRGRIYTATTGLTPQGADYAKSLLRFHTGKPLGDRGLFWLKVHLANCYGIDKVSFEDRIKWVEENHCEIMRFALDSFRSIGWWKSADQPWQFLAAAQEYFNAYHTQRPTEYISQLPISLDGTCNGLQNYSALLRDETGANETNLIPGSSPKDIYKTVAECTTSELKAVLEKDSYTQRWLDIAARYGGSLPRSLVKRVVMTLPYGVTKHSCQNYINEWLVEEDKCQTFSKDESFKAAGYLSPFVWKAIEQTVQSAIVGMKWLHEASVILTDKDLPCVWWSYLGFPIRMDNMRHKSKKINTQIGGRVQLRIQSPTEGLDRKRQRSGIAPNFIHALDACHLMLTVEAAAAEGVTSFAAVHDSFGTHACHVDILARSLREAFVEMYSNYNALEEFKAVAEAAYGVVLPELPQRGTLNINQVLDSKYFFA